MNKISEHITLKEATFSTNAVRNGINNMPDDNVLSKMKIVAENVFEPLRKWYGNPIKITSFYRSPELNKAIGGSEDSQHCLGEAIDIDAGVDNNKLFDWVVKNLEYDQIIKEFGTEEEPAWIHISFSRRHPNRQMNLRAIKENGKTKYLTI